MKLDPHHLASERVAAAFDGGANRFRSAGVRAERNIDAFENPGVGHDYLATYGFFGRSAEHRYSPFRTGFDRCLQADACGDARDSDQIMPAAMANSRKRVVFRKKSNAWSGVANRR